MLIHMHTMYVAQDTVCHSAVVPICLSYPFMKYLFLVSYWSPMSLLSQKYYMLDKLEYT